MGEHDEAPLQYYDRHIADWSPPETASGTRGRQFFGWLDVVGLFLPVWLLLLALAIGTPLIASVRDRDSAGGYAISLALYGGIVVWVFILPYVAAYCVWRVAGVLVGVTPAFMTALFGLALGLGLIAVRGGSDAPTALLSYGCAVGLAACSAQRLASIGRTAPGQGYSDA